MKRLFTFIVVIVLTVAAFAEEKKYIGNVMSSGAEDHYTIVVETVPKKLYLLRVSGDNQSIIDSADVLTGREGGSKTIQNDGKTPEGVYYIIDYMSDSEMRRKWGQDVAYKYGIASFPTNYPNPIDKIMRRTGYGIWLHGLDPDRHKPATEGCVAMQNTDLERIMPNISMETPIVIINNALFLTAEEYQEEREEHLKDLYTFIKAWNSGDYDTFKAYIHPKYSSYAAVNQAAYLAKKKSLMESYPDKQISIENINIYRQNEVTLVYDFDQFYCADNLVSYGNKKFYLVNEDGTDKLISEEMDPAPVQTYLQPYIEAFVEEWRQAWQSQDIEKYMAYYSPRFSGRNQWEANKTAIFADNENISVDISNLKWELAGGNNVRITFTQHYKADQNEDRGIKTLVISGCPGTYTIRSENWSAR